MGSSGTGQPWQATDAPSPGAASSTLTFADALGQYGEAPAIVTQDGRRLTYLELAALADRFAEGLGSGRRLVMIEAANELEPLVAYLGCLRARHPVMLVAGGPGAQHDRVIETYRPNVRFRKTEAGWTTAVEAGPPSLLHPDLAVLLSTSGTTGAVKMVRLSYGAVHANAASIAAYLKLDARCRAITSLPIHYSYGLSVITSHLLAGGALLLTDRSVIDDAFWTFFTAEGATSLAGVPYTYELLDRIGFTSKALPSLRQITQAGGRLSPASVRRYAQWAEHQGADFFVMYGQTEATARMAYVPPDKVLDRPETIGLAIPGGRFSLIDDDQRPVTEPGAAGELVYHGPNIMMGYALTAEDLAKGPEISALHTGDLAQRDADGLYRIVGRKSRFSKLFGLRLGLDEIEAGLARRQLNGAVSGDDEGVAIAVEPGPGAADLADDLGREYKIPASAFDVEIVPALPRLANGKIDYRRILDRAKARRAAAADLPQASGAAPIRAAFASAFPRAAIKGGDSFISLGGDSLTYVNLSLDIERWLGALPERWEERTVDDLQALARPTSQQPRWWQMRSTESEMLLRAFAIIAVVINHASDWAVGGGADVLLILAGYNLARYQRTRLLGDSGQQILKPFFLRVIAPYYVLMVVYFIIKRQFDWPSLLLISNFTGRFGSLLEPYWFLELLLQCMAIMVALMALAPLRAAAVRRPWAFGLALLAASLLVKVLVFAGLHHDALQNRTPDALFYLVAMGWCVYQATTRRQRLLLTALALAIATSDISGAYGIWPRFGYPANDTHASWLVIAIVLMLWVPKLRLPGPLHWAVGIVAAASFYIYLTHGVPVHILASSLGIHNLALALTISLATGLLAWQATVRISALNLFKGSK